MIGLIDMAIPPYIPMFHWVVAATGDSDAAIVYGVMWQRAQFTHGECEITTAHIAHKLNLSHRVVERHIATLSALGLIRCPNLLARHRCFVLPSREEWEAEVEGLDAVPMEEVVF